MSIKGNLESFSLGEIFQSLSMNQHTGTLRVWDGQSEKKIYFSRGEVCLISTGARETAKLGDYLVKNKIVTADAIQKALKIQEKSGKKLGEILLASKLITTEDLSAAIRYKIEEEIYELFLWEKAEFEFMSNLMDPELDDPMARATKIKLNSNSLIMESLRRIDEWQRIHQTIPGFHIVFTKKNLHPNVVARVDAPEMHKIELESVDGLRSVDEIIKNSRLSRFELCKLLFEFLRQGVIGRHKKEEYLKLAETALKHRPWKEAEKFYRNALDLDPEDVNLRVVFANLLKSHDQPADAVAEFRYLARLYFHREQIPKAVSFYTTALDLDPNNTGILDELLKSYEAADQVVEAVPVAEKLAAIMKQDLNFHQAIEYYQKLNVWLPDNVEYLKELAESYRSLNQKEYASRYYESVADKYAERGDFIESAKNYKIILSLDDKRQDVRAKLAAVNKSQRRKERVFVRRLIRVSAAAAILAVLLCAADVIWSYVKFSAAMDVKEELLKQYKFNKIRDRLQDAAPIVPYLPPASAIRAEIADVDKKESEYFVTTAEYINRKKKMISDGMAAAEGFKKNGKFARVYEEYYNLYKKFPEEIIELGVRFPASLNSVPQGARVLLNGREEGTTPCVAWYPPDNNPFITLAHERYEPKKVYLNFGKYEDRTETLVRAYVWEARLGGTIEIPPVAFKDSVYTALSNGTVVALSLADGKVLWTAAVSSKQSKFTEFTPAADKYLYFGTLNADLKRVQIGGKGVSDSFPNINSVYGPLVPIRADEELLFVPEYGKADFIRPWDATIVWTISLPLEKGRVSGRAAVAGGVLMFAASEGWACRYVYSERQSTYEDFVPLDGPANTGGATDGKCFYTASDKGTLYAFPVAGQWNEKAKRTLGADVAFSPAVGASRVFVSTADGAIHALGKDKLEETWRTALPQQEARALRLYSDILYAVGPGGMYALDAETGEKVWEYKAETGEPFIGSVEAVKGGVILATEKGTVLMIWEKSGE
jgi:outer membrane protein assembly factor BamB/tetratricopeptide (TPR) repeat protein